MRQDDYNEAWEKGYAAARREINLAAMNAALIEALRGVLPYARSRAEDLNEWGGESVFWRRANANIEAAERLIGESL